MEQKKGPLLKDGCRYDLLASSTKSGSVSVLHVKLTDTALKAIEEYYVWSRKTKVIVIALAYITPKSSQIQLQDQ